MGILLFASCFLFGASKAADNLLYSKTEKKPNNITIQQKKIKHGLERIEENLKKRTNNHVSKSN